MPRLRIRRFSSVHNRYTYTRVALTPQQILRVWAPTQSPWSPWVKPVLFTQASDWLAFADLDDLMVTTANVPRASQASSGSLIMGGAKKKIGKVAVVVDLLGAEAVNLGLMLARTHGFRPVPLFNGCAGEKTRWCQPAHCAKPWSWAPANSRGSQSPTTHRPPFCWTGTDCRIGPNFCPVSTTTVGWYFSRIFLPLIFCESRGSRASCSSNPLANAPLHDDLAHVLRHWQVAGLALHSGLLASDGRLRVEEFHVPLPSLFRE